MQFLIFVCGGWKWLQLENFELRVLRSSGTAGAGVPAVPQLGYPYQLPLGANHLSLASASMDDLPPIYSTMTSEATASMASVEDEGNSVPPRRLLSKEVRAQRGPRNPPPCSFDSFIRPTEFHSGRVLSSSRTVKLHFQKVFSNWMIGLCSAFLYEITPSREFHRACAAC